MKNKKNMTYLILGLCCLIFLSASSKNVSKKNKFPQKNTCIDKTTTLLRSLIRECVMGEIFRDSIKDIVWL